VFSQGSTWRNRTTSRSSTRRWQENTSARTSQLEGRFDRQPPAISPGSMVCTGAPRRVAKTIVEGVASLRTFPNRGRPGRVEGTSPLRRRLRGARRSARSANSCTVRSHGRNRTRTFDRAPAALLLSQSQEWVSTRRSPRRQIGGGDRDKHQRRQGDADTDWVLWTEPEQH
jgi:hypothetical protein